MASAAMELPMTPPRGTEEDTLDTLILSPWGGGGRRRRSFQRWRPEALSEDFWPDATASGVLSSSNNKTNNKENDSNHGQLTLKPSTLNSMAFAGDSALQMKWAPSPAWQEVKKDDHMRCRTSNAATPVGPEKTPNLRRRRTLGPGEKPSIEPLSAKAGVKDVRPPVLSLSKLDWAKIDKKEKSKKPQQITVGSGDLARCKGDLQALQQCQLPDREPQETFKSAFENRCRMKGGHIKDPWKNLPNPERTRCPTEKDLILNQIWPPSPAKLRFQRIHRLRFDLADALRTTNKEHTPPDVQPQLARSGPDRPASGGNRRHSWSDPASRPSPPHALRGGSSSGGFTRLSSSSTSTSSHRASTSSSSVPSTRPGSASASSQSTSVELATSASASHSSNSPRCEGSTSRPTRPGSAVAPKRSSTTNRRQSFGPGDDRPATISRSASLACGLVSSQIPERERRARRRSL